MKTTGLFTAFYFDLGLLKINETLQLAVFGDVHEDSPLNSRKEWLRYLRKLQHLPNPWFFGMGDYGDIASSKERKVINRADDEAHDTLVKHLRETYPTKWANHYMQDIGFMAKFGPQKEQRICGMIEGNHFGELRDRTTTTQYMCKHLGCKYLGVATLSRLAIWRTSTTRATLDIYAHHGLGAARTVGGSIMPVARLQETASADIYLMGHDHQRCAHKRARLRLQEVGSRSKPGPDGTKQMVIVSHRDQLLARTGGFLRGYEPGHKSYVTDKGYTPTAMGGLIINIGWIRDGRTYRLEAEALI